MPQLGSKKPNVSAALKGRQRPDISARQRGVPSPKKGVPLSSETKEKLRIAALQRATPAWNKGLTKDDPRVAEAEAKRRQVRQYSAEHPLAIQARSAVSTAVRYGKIQKPNACQECKRPCSGGALHAHHHAGYEPENWLDITWLCRSCHGKVHNGAV